MDQHNETFETWNKVAQLYQEKFMDRDVYNATYDYFCDRVAAANASVLELGCGPGNVTKYLLSKRPGFRLHGIDYSPNMVALARSNNPTAQFSVMDCRSLTEVTGSYDGIICSFCAPYLSQMEIQKLVSDCCGLLNQGGHIYISFVEGDPSDSGFRAASTGDRTYFYYHTTVFMEELMVKLGFEPPTVFKIPYPAAEENKELHIVLIARKGAEPVGLGVKS